MTLGGHYSCWHAYVTFGGKVKGQGQFFFLLEMDFSHVKLTEKTIYPKIITARAAVFYLLWVKGQGQFFLTTTGSVP